MSSVDPGEGYRLLVKGEPIREDVSYYVKGKWHKMSTDSNVGEPWNDVDFFPMRVPKEIADNAGILVTTSGPYVAIEVHRAALKEIDRLQWELRDSKVWWKKEIERLKAELEAVKQAQPKLEPEWFDLTPFDSHQMRVQTDYAFHAESGEWRHTSAVFSVSTVGELKKLGFTQFRCLLRDAPPELVAKASKPTEDPDEWVTQDRVPCRPKIDEITWEDKIVGPDSDCGWLLSQVGATSCWRMHGYELGPHDVLSVRCRRRDLPPMPEKPKTETVTFHECIVRRDGTRKLEWIECPSEGCVGTGRTSTREVVR